MGATISNHLNKRIMSKRGKKVNPLFKSSAIYKCIIKLGNGMHRTYRFTIDKVAKMCGAVRQMKDFGLHNARYREFFIELGIFGQTISECRFINEDTGEELLSIA